MEPFQKYVTCIMAFFLPFHSTCVTLCQVYYIASTELVAKNNKIWNGVKEDVLYVWLFQRITLY